MKLIIITFFIFVLSCSQAFAKKSGSSQATAAPSILSSSEVFDVSLGEEMVQIDSQEINNGYMYTFTNNGISPFSEDLNKKVIVVEINGKQKPYRLKRIFPNYCSEISYSDTTTNDYRTWIDILSCPYYDDPSSGKGLLVINKSIQGTDKLFGATLYKTIPKYTKNNIQNYRELPLSHVEIKDILKLS